MNDAEIKLQVSLDSDSASKSINTLQTKTESLSKAFTSAGKTLTLGLTAPLIALGTYAVTTASDLVETQNKVEVAFGDSADAVTDWGETTLKQYGIAKTTSLDMAATFGDMATAMGYSQDSASSLSMNIVGLAGDLASFKNISLDVAKTALTGIFTGETESLKSLGIVMTETNLEQYALSQGITKNIDDMTQAEKVQLRYSYVTSVSANALGDFARTSDSTSNQTRTVTETFKEVSAELGENLLPIVNAILSKVLEFLNWFGSLSESQQNFILTVLAVVVALGPMLLIIGNIIKVVGLLTKATALFNVTLLASPITWIVLGIIALIAIIVLLITHWDDVVATVKNVGSVFTSVFSAIWNFLGNIFDNMMARIKLVGSVFVSIFTTVGNVLGSIFKGLGNVFISLINTVIKGLNLLISGILAPFNLIIKGLNKIPGVNIATLSYSIKTIPYLKTGTNFVAQEGLAYLHQGEAVVPKKYNPALTGGSSQNVIVQNYNTMTLDGTKVYENQQTVTSYKTLQTGFGG